MKNEIYLFRAGRLNVSPVGRNSFEEKSAKLRAKKDAKKIEVEKILAKKIK